MVIKSQSRGLYGNEREELKVALERGRSKQMMKLCIREGMLKIYDKIEDYIGGVQK